MTPKSIASAVNLLKNDKDLYSKLAANAVKMSMEMNWENESKKLLSLYSNVLKKLIEK